MNKYFYFCVDDDDNEKKKLTKNLMENLLEYDL